MNCLLRLVEFTVYDQDSESGEDDLMRLVLISDTHGLHDKVGPVPAGRCPVHAGDLMNSLGYDVQDIVSFNRWLGEQDFRHRVVCAGNHDRYFENAPQQARELLTNATYLENTGATFDGVAFWGSPYTPEFMNWAFMYHRGSGAGHWELIPDNLDVLITHGPPLGILDQTAPGEPHLGCAELLDTVKSEARIGIFGHIHGGAGTFENNETRFINAAYLNERYKPLPPAGKIHIVDISLRNFENT